MLARMSALFLLALLLIPQSQQPRPNPCDAPEFRHFDFWIGDWNVKSADGTRTLGTNVIERIAGNCGLQENWIGAGGGSGRSLNTFQRSDGKWHQVWVGMGGGMLRLAGGLQDGKMVLEGMTAGPNQQKSLQRVTWSPLSDGRVRQLWETSNDDGKTWNVTFDGYYTRKPRS